MPKEVADTPWSVVIQYKTAAGEQKAPETVATFAPGKETTFEALPPGAGDQLQTVEVKQAGGVLIQGETGPEPVTRAAWSLQAPDAAYGSSSRATARTTSATRLVFLRSG